MCCDQFPNIRRNELIGMYTPKTWHPRAAFTTGRARRSVSLGLFDRTHILQLRSPCARGCRARGLVGEWRTQSRPTWWFCHRYESSAMYAPEQEDTCNPSAVSPFQNA